MYNVNINMEKIPNPSPDQERKEEKKIKKGKKTKDKGMVGWSQKMLDEKLISPSDYYEFTSGNESKESTIDAMGLPMLRHYGVFESIEDIRKKFEPDDKRRFVIRCTLKKTGEMTRSVDVDLDGVIDFAEKLPGKIDKYIAEMDPADFDLHYNWGVRRVKEKNGEKTEEEKRKEAKELAEMQGHALKAARYIFGDKLKPREGEPIYADFGIRKEDNSVYFLDVNDARLLTDK